MQVESQLQFFNWSRQQQSIDAVVKDIWKLTTRKRHHFALGDIQLHRIGSTPRFNPGEGPLENLLIERRVNPGVDL
ncbi:hypothetical protein J6590_079413 [Homalodisca vitripennis]|nr:hypothetical protein J6590_079413 [Homalodisca vitripennis]